MVFLYSKNLFKFRLFCFLMDIELPKLSKREETAAIDIGRLYSQFLKKAVANYSIAKEYLEIANIDFKNLKLLIDRNERYSYPLMAFLIQQIVEKYTKAYTLLFGAISKKNMKEISHKSGMAFVKSLRQADLGGIFKKIKRVSHIFYVKGFADDILSLNLIKESDKMESIIISTDAENLNLNEVLDSFEVIRKQIGGIFISRSFNENFYAGFTKWARPLIELFYDKKRLEENKMILFIQYDLICFLYPMVFVTSKHEIMSRYPKIAKEKYSPKDYVNSNVDLIKQRARIVNNLERISERINMMFNLTKGLSNMSSVRRDSFFKKIMEKAEKEFGNNKEK